MLRIKLKPKTIKKCFPLWKCSKEEISLAKTVNYKAINLTFSNKFQKGNEPRVSTTTSQGALLAMLTTFSSSPTRWCSQSKPFWIVRRSKISKKITCRIIWSRTRFCRSRKVWSLIRNTRCTTWKAIQWAVAKISKIECKLSIRTQMQRGSSTSNRVGVITVLGLSLRGTIYLRGKIRCFKRLFWILRTLGATERTTWSRMMGQCSLKILLMTMLFNR